MEFNPSNRVIQLCLQGMELEEQNSPDDASALFHQAWNEATNDFEKFIAAHYVARHQSSVSERLYWLQEMLALGQKINSEQVKSAFPTVYAGIAKCYEELNDHGNAKLNYELAKAFADNSSDKGPFYHGTKANLKVGDLLTPGFNSNYTTDLTMNHIYFTALVNGAGLAAALAKGDGSERVYIVEPMGSFENDPNVTDKKFPGNPTRSYRTTASLKIVGEVTDWMRQRPQDIKAWREKLAKSKGEIIN